MARNAHKPDKFDRLASQLAEAAGTLTALSEEMRESKMPEALIHGATVLTIHLPAVLDWVNKTNGDVRSQIRAYVDGIQSQAEFQKEKNEKAKASAAQKPWKKKVSKKKA